MTNEQLKPCPMCDSKARISDLNGIANRDDILAIVACADCGVSAYSTSSTEEAVAKWNRRAAPVGEAQPKCHSGACEGVADDNAALNAENALLRQRLDEGQEGWKLVPIEPTPEMVHAALTTPVMPDDVPPIPTGWTMNGLSFRTRYRAALFAAPTPRLETPEQGEADRRDAERYRWLAGDNDGDAQGDLVAMMNEEVMSKAAIDSFIDAAMRAQQKGEPE